MSKILGIGNAITDIVCKIDDIFLQENNLIKGSMSLIDEVMIKKLSTLNPEKISSGGSVANTISAISQLGIPCSFIGKVAIDEIGRKFIEEIEKTNAKFIAEEFSNNISAQSFILVSKDAQRTMCTFLGCASEIDENDIKEDEIKSAKILYLEGYLWDKKNTISALKKAIFLAKKHQVKIAFTLSDLFCVARHKPDFIDLITNDLDILFANEFEIQELLNLENIAENNFKKLLDFFSINKKLIAAITRSEKGCAVFNNNFYFEQNAQNVENLIPFSVLNQALNLKTRLRKPITIGAQSRVLKNSIASFKNGNGIIDTTGAGDAFAAGFLFGINNNFTLEKSAEIGNILAAKIIQKFGARFNENEINEIKNVI